MNRRYCDRYKCEECPVHSEYTKALKEVMKEKDCEFMKSFLKRYKTRLTNLYDKDTRYKKEWICMMHYYNPNGIYDV